MQGTALVATHGEEIGVCFDPPGLRSGESYFAADPPRRTLLEQMPERNQHCGLIEA